MSTSTHKSTESTRENLPQNNDLLKNDIVIRSFCLIFLCICNILYLSQVFPKKVIASSINASESQAQCKSLNIDLVEPENTVQPAPSRRMEMDFAYLLPVFEIKLES